MRIWAVATPGEIRAVAAEGDDPVDVAIERPGQPDGVGALHRGRVVARVPSLAGSFVRLHDNSEGFLPDSAAPPGLSVGDGVAARITRAAQGGKGPRLGAATADPAPPALLAPGQGAVARLAALHPAAPVHAADARLFAALRSTLNHRVSRATMPDALADAVDALEQPGVALPGGARATFTPTPALVAIDIDTAAASERERAAKSAGQASINRALLPALARHLRARNLSGAILIDLAGLPPRKRRAIAPEFAAILAHDPAGARLVGVTGLGLLEIVRTRAHPPLHELLAGPHAAGLRAAAKLAAESAARPAERLGLRTATDVHAALLADAAALHDLAESLGHPPIITSDPALPPGQWSLDRLA